MTSSNQWIKVLLTLSVVVSVAVTMKLAVPLMLNFVVNDLPATWFIVISWLKPPYLYLLINGIIITIVASTRFNQNQNNNQYQHQHQLINPSNTDLMTSEPPHETTSPVVYDIKPIVMVVNETIKRCDLDILKDVSTTSTSDTGAIKSPPKFNYPTIKEKQISTSRFPHNKKPSQGARALRVLKPKKHETMDSTWKMITDGRHNKHLRKSDTFVNIQHSSSTNEFKKVVKKSETFKDRTNYENENQYLQPMVMSGGNLNKDNSLSHDELNNRVEAFIKKFNDDMRLQRQQSLNLLKPGLH